MKMDATTVNVIGHTNPDTDSICSAIAYAYLKRQVTGENYVAKRAGQINAESKFVLDYFKAEIPEYFEIGKDLETYESMEELEQKVQYYLNHEEERIEIAINGYEKVAKYHTYEQRLAEMIRILDSTL